MNYTAVIQKTRAYLCLDCGKCTGSCPLARVDPDFSPRRIVERVVFGEGEAVISDPRLWSCMTCGLCSERCPSNVDYTQFIIEMRAEAFRSEERGTYAHDGVLQEIMRIQTMDIHQKRTDWLTGDLEVAEEGEYLYFVGCLPFFDIVFRDLSFQALDIARNAVRLMNRVGIKPIISNDERCCGADLLLAGDLDSFRQLAERNVEAIRASGAKKVVFTCAECYNAFERDYPSIAGNLSFEMMHLTELLAPHVEQGDLIFEPMAEMVTYHDPCRLGRYQGVYDPPRRVIQAVPNLTLVEMEDNRERAMCCGSTAWINCSGCAKQIQQEKLHQARQTGAIVMLTTCPKCQIHLSCAARDQDPDQAVEVEDVISWVGKALG
jgi:heterodisulfide reductase subunit D